MRTSKNVRVRQGGGRIFYQSALLCPQQESLSLAANGYDANQLPEQEGQDWEKKTKQGNRGEQGDEQSCREGKYMNKRCVLCHQSSTLLHTVIKQKPFHLTVSVHRFHCDCCLTGNLDQLSDLSKQKWYSDRDSGNSILMHRIRTGVGESCLMGSISLKPHWFAVGVTGAQVTAGSPQLEMNLCSLMRSRDERVANYPKLLCTGNNLLLLGLSMINLLQLLLYLFYTLNDLRGV